jgi:ribonuclease P protein component
MAYHSHCISLFVYKKSDISPSQFSFSVSKKVAKSAVIRNKLRRRGYAAIKGMLAKIKLGYYCMFSFKKGASTLSASDISKEVQDILKPLVTTASV